jgi:hypothetical protein
MDATNIINGISSEKPVLDFVLYIEYVWSAYEVMGEIMIKTGAMKPVKKDTIPILKEVSGTRWKIRNLMGRVYNASMYYMYKKKMDFELGRVAMSRRSLEVDANLFQGSITDAHGADRDWAVDHLNRGPTFFPTASAPL